MNSDIKSLNGKRIGHWTILEDVGRASNNEVQWLCQCDCGTIRKVCGGKLRQGRSKSCGCTSDKNDISGQQIGSWTILKRTRDHQGDAKWLCRHNDNDLLLLFDKTKINTPLDFNIGNGKWIKVGVSGDKLSSSNREWILANGHEKGQCVVAKCSKTGIVAIFSNEEFESGPITISLKKQEPVSIAKDLSGQIYRTWEVLKRKGNNKHGQAMWECQCNVCGAYKTAAGFAIKKGQSCRSCKKLGYNDKVYSSNVNALPLHNSIK